MSRTDAWSYRKSATCWASINPEPQLGNRRPNCVMAMMHQATTTLIAATPTLISCPGQTAIGTMLFASSADWHFFLKRAPQTPIVAAPPHDSR